MSTTMTIATVDLHDGGDWWILFSDTPKGIVLYSLAVMGKAGARALVKVIGGEHGTEAEIEDHEGFLAAVEAACEDPTCLGHQVRRLTIEQQAEFTETIRQRQRPN